MTALRSLQQTEWSEERDRYRQAAFDLLTLARILHTSAQHLHKTNVRVAEPAAVDIADAIELLSTLPSVAYGKEKQ